MYTITDSTQHQMKTPPPPPHHRLPCRSHWFTLTYSTWCWYRVSPRFTRFTYTLHCTLTHLLAHTIMPNRLHSQQTALDCLLGIFLRFLFHTLRNPPELPLSPPLSSPIRLFPSCIRSLCVNIVLRTLHNDVRDPAAASWHPSGPWGSNRRDNPSQTPSCEQIWNPLLGVTASDFAPSRRIVFFRIVTFEFFLYQILIKNTYF